MEPDALNALCWAAGITTAYGDREVPEETKRALLAALGVSVDTPPEKAGLPRYDTDPSAAPACRIGSHSKRIARLPPARCR